MRKLSFFISEAVIGMKRSYLMILIAIGTITVSLMIFGFFLLININLTHFSEFISSHLEIRVFLKPELTRDQINSFQSQLSQMDNVKNVQFINKELAWNNFIKSYKHLDLNKMIKNPLPHSLKVRLGDNRDILKKTEIIELYTDYVTDVKNGGIITTRMMAFKQWIQYSGLVLGLFLMVATLFIIINTIRLTIMNRQDEISIMKLVGATDPFIRGPFLIEGVVIGVMGSGCAILFLKNIYFFLGQKLQEGIPFIPIVFEVHVLNTVYLFLGITGVGLGLVGAYISVTKSLKLTV
jgi:cell division transport system permease protein